MISLLVTIVGGVSVLLNHDKRLLKKDENDFRYNYDFCRKNLRNFYFNDSDCNCIAKALEKDKMLQAELDCLLKYHNFDDGIQILINRKKISL